MPANKKYLTTSKWQRFAKVSAAILGGYLVTMMLHMVLAVWITNATGAILVSSIFSAFILWVFFMIVPFWAKNGWKVWAWYILIIIICYALIQYGKSFNPIFAK